MSRIVDIEPLLHKYDCMNEGTEFSPIHFINDLMALEQQPCEDCISREVVRRILANQRDELVKLHTVNPKDNPKADAMAYGVNWSLNTLMELPSVTPKQKVGKWIFHEPFDNGCNNCNKCIECSQCHIWFGYDYYDKTLYCPYCGAKMEGSDVQ